MKCNETINEYFEDEEAVLDLIRDALADFEWVSSNNFTENVEAIKEEIDVFLSEQAYRLIFDEDPSDDYYQTVSSNALNRNQIQEMINAQDIDNYDSEEGRNDDEELDEDEE